MARGALYGNPEEVSANPIRWYPDGVLENYVNPVPGSTYRGPGGFIPPPSDQRLTIISDVETMELAPLYPSPASGMASSDMPLIATHEGHPVDTSEPRSLDGLQATSTNYTIEGKVNEWIGALRGSPIAALFLGLAGIIVFSEVVLRNRARGVSSGAASIGRVAATPGATAASAYQATEKTALDSMNKAVGGAVEAVEGAAGS